MYVYSKENNAFYPLSMRQDYIDAGTWPSDGIEVDDSVFEEFYIAPPGKIRVGGDDGLPVWADIPTPPNSELRKAALAALSSTYQDDIEKLNRAWLAAAVNDGVNETAKKDVVLAQINTRKTQYATERAEIIAQYPD